ncbi:MAG: hypothetical protein IT376_08310 [Polyangiaceae bacterium]|nr:hypothetical protein [Polyangiaceae bacterium]
MMRRDAAPLLFCEARIAARGAVAPAGKRSFAVVASTERVDSHGTRLRQNGRLDR